MCVLDRLNRYESVDLKAVHQRMLWICAVAAAAASPIVKYLTRVRGRGASLNLHRGYLETLLLHNCVT